MLGPAEPGGLICPSYLLSSLWPKRGHCPIIHLVSPAWGGTPVPALFLAQDLARSPSPSPAKSGGWTRLGKWVRRLFKRTAPQGHHRLPGPLRMSLEMWWGGWWTRAGKAREGSSHSQVQAKITKRSGGREGTGVTTANTRATNAPAQILCRRWLLSQLREPTSRSPSTGPDHRRWGFGVNILGGGQIRNHNQNQTIKNKNQETPYIIRKGVSGSL